MEGRKKRRKEGRKETDDDHGDEKETSSRGLILCHS